MNFLAELDWFYWLLMALAFIASTFVVYMIARWPAKAEKKPHHIFIQDD